MNRHLKKNNPRKLGLSPLVRLWHGLPRRHQPREAWLECNGQAIDTKYTRLRELVGDHTPNYQGVFLRGYGSQKANVIYSRNHVGGDNNLPNLVQTFHSDSLGKIQTDSIRPNVGVFTDILSVDSGGTNYWNNLGSIIFLVG